MIHQGAAQISDFAS